jgi:uncharacterized NAD(P)/FAD-binding protein YdhS
MVRSREISDGPTRLHETRCVVQCAHCAPGDTDSSSSHLSRRGSAGESSPNSHMPGLLSHMQFSPSQTRLGSRLVPHSYILIAGPKTTVHRPHPANLVPMLSVIQRVLCSPTRRSSALHGSDAQPKSQDPNQYPIPFRLRHRASSPRYKNLPDIQDIP